MESVTTIRAPSARSVACSVACRADGSRISRMVIFSVPSSILVTVHAASVVRGGGEGFAVVAREDAPAVADAGLCGAAAGAAAVTTTAAAAAAVTAVAPAVIILRRARNLSPRRQRAR